MFGYNIFFEYINNFLDKENYKLSGIIDNDTTKQGKRIFNIRISSPEIINWEDNVVVLIASKHKKDMEDQVRRLSSKAELYILIDFIQYTEKLEKESMFWIEENYQSEIQKLYRGEIIYNRLKKEERLVVFLSALGDMFAGGLYLYEYEKKLGSEVKVVVASQGVYKIAQLFNIKNVVMISESEMDDLIKYIFFQESGDEDLCTCINSLDIMAIYKKIPFPRFWAKYYFKLEDGYQMIFPSIWSETVEEKLLTEKGIVKKKTVVLAPYANSIEELPIQFWACLAEKLLVMNYYVLTNVIGNQKPVKGTKGIEIPLNQIGNYLEYAGYFISLRSGLCDVAGQSLCKKIVIFRDREFSDYCSQMEFFDLKTDGIAKDVIQMTYDDNDFFENINNVINLL